MKATEVPLTTPARAAEVGRDQCAAFVRQLEKLDGSQWLIVTECDPWTVQDVAAHVDGALDYTRNPFAYAGLVAGWLRWYRDRSFLDGTNQAAIRARRGWTTARLLEALRADSARAVPPRWARPIPLLGVANLPRYATFGYLTDVVLPRDSFMHRLDVARATGSELEPAASDADVVAQVVRDLGLQWKGPAFTLRLTGPAGGTWQLGATAEDPGDANAELDAVAFLRHLSGRQGDAPLFDDAPPPLRSALTDARVTF